MKKIFNSYLELGSLNQFLLFISFIILNVLLTKLFLFLEIDTTESYIYSILRPVIGLLTILSFLLIFKKTPKITKSGKKIDGAPRGLYALLAIIMMPAGFLFALISLHSFYKMSQSDYDFSRVVYGVSGEAAHIIILALLLIGSTGIFISSIKLVVAIVKNKKIKD